MNFLFTVINNTTIRFFAAIICLVIFSSSTVGQEIKDKGNIQKRFTILGLGDSITEGGATFQTYLFPLWEKLFTAGYNFDFIGPNINKCRIGTLSCGGFGGRNAEFLEAHIDSIYRKYPADIVLLHAGHNHFETENPIGGIIAAQESIIQKIRKINPGVKIMVAQVITSGKLPKYSYIPELNKNIAKMVKRQNSQNVVLVNQAKDFDWQQYTISDKVHPNAAGAEKMADIWFAALKKILAPAEQIFTPEILTYKKLDSGDLKLHIFKPKNFKKGEKRAAIVYFFGGGWSFGTPLQFYRECAYYASKGMVAITADYRISYLHKTTPFESVEDAKDAIRWLRQNAARLNLDPNRIAASGSSAGGHLAAATGILRDANPKQAAFCSKPNLLLLYYPVIDNSEKGYGSAEMKKRYMEISPLQNIDASTPPTLFIVGTKDPLIPVQTANEFKTEMEKYGVDCELCLFEGAVHPIFLYAKPLTADFYQIRKISDHFLQKYGYLNNH